MKPCRRLWQPPSRAILQSQSSLRRTCYAVGFKTHLDITSTSRKTFLRDSQWLSHLPLGESFTVAGRSNDISNCDQKRRLLLSESLNNPGSSQGPRSDGNDISDHEYQTRVSKACQVIVDSLPDFMHKGVVDLQDLECDDAVSSSHGGRSGWSAKGLLPSLSPFLGQSLLRRSSWAIKGKDKSNNGTTTAASNDDQVFDSLYHPSIAFEFRPPLPHIGIGKSETVGDDAATSQGAGTFSNSSEGEGGTGKSLNVYDEHARGGPTICFNGRTMYVASSHLLRHALSALFHDTSICLESARFEGRSKAGSSWPGISPYIKRSTQSGTRSDANHSDDLWQDKLVVRLRFEGIARMTSHQHTYTVIFKYAFDRKTGMIVKHSVDNIQPVPGSKVWTGLSHAWGTLSPAAAAGSTAACSSSIIARRLLPSRVDPKQKVVCSPPETHSDSPVYLFHLLM